MRRPSLLALFAIVSFAVSACATFPRGARSHLLRLKPGMDVTAELARYAKEKSLRAATIVSAVGSLTHVALRFANQPGATRLRGHFEVVSLSGYLADGELHAHMAVSDGEGKTTGGHLMP